MTERINKNIYSTNDYIIPNFFSLVNDLGQFITFMEAKYRQPGKRKNIFG